MKNTKIVFLIIIIHLCSFITAGCWNYKEIEQLAIVSGVAIDKASEGKVLVTTEIVNVKSDPVQSTLQPVYIQKTGDTFLMQ